MGNWKQAAIRAAAQSMISTVGPSEKICNINFRGQSKKSRNNRNARQRNECRNCGQT